MRILVTNDDGWFAQGLQALQKALSDAGHDVVVVAPDRNRSGMSGALTLQHTIRGQQHGDKVWSVEGTPVDCVHYGLGVVYPGLDQQPPDMIVSGMNHGPNLGDDTLYSGTVAAAIEGRFLQWPALAVSMNARQTDNWPVAGELIVQLIAQLPNLQLKQSRVLNINIPNVAADEIQGMKITTLGSRSQFAMPELTKDTRGRSAYWIGAAGEFVPDTSISNTSIDVDDAKAIADSANDGHPDTSNFADSKKQHIGGMADFAALKAGYVSITPIQTDMTARDDLNNVAHWVEDFA